MIFVRWRNMPRMSMLFLSTWCVLSLSSLPVLQRLPMLSCCNNHFFQHAHTHTSPDWQIADIYIYIYIYIYKISISPNLNDQMSRLQCSQLHFCPEWNDEDQENQGKINATLKKMHATSGHIVYLYICNCSLDMHNTWDEWLQQKIASSKFTVSCISLLFITSHRSMMFAWGKKNNGEFWGMLNVTSATISTPSFELSSLLVVS